MLKFRNGKREERWEGRPRRSRIVVVVVKKLFFTRGVSSAKALLLESPENSSTNTKNIYDLRKN